MAKQARSPSFEKTQPIPKTCIGCGVNFSHGRSDKKFCTAECGDRFRDNKEHQRVSALRLAARSGKVCVSCHQPFTPKRSDAKYCSIKCTNKFHWGLQKKACEALPPSSCLHCFETFTPKSKTQKHCSDRCAKARSYQNWYAEVKRRRAEERGNIPRRECVECGAMFDVTHRDANRQKFCSRVCLFRHHSGESHAQREAAIISDGSDKIEWLIVAERYQWKCAMCNVELKKEHRGKRLSTAPEIDHIVLISKGGKHVYRNVQLLCYSCNKTKSSRIIPAVSLFETGG